MWNKFITICTQFCILTIYFIIVLAFEPDFTLENVTEKYRVIRGLGTRKNVISLKYAQAKWNIPNAQSLDLMNENEWNPFVWTTSDNNVHKDLVQPNETHLEGVPVFLKHPKPLYYTLKDHPATIECVAEPVSHAVIECAEKVIPYKGPEEPGALQVIRLDSQNRPDPNGQRWKLRHQVKAKEVEEWFDSYVCRCEAWNKIVELQRPKKVISKSAVVVEAYLERRFRLEPMSKVLIRGQRLDLMCIPPDGKPEPEVYWMKNGIRMNHANVKYLSSGQIHLTIQNISLNDTGNYTCVAELLGIEYRFANALVIVRDTASQIHLIRNLTLEKSRAKSDQFSVPRDMLIFAAMFLILLAVAIVILTILCTRNRKEQRHNWFLGKCIQSSKRKHSGMFIKNPAMYSALLHEKSMPNDLVLMQTTGNQPHRSQNNHSLKFVTPYQTLDQISTDYFKNLKRLPDGRSHPSIPQDSNDAFSDCVTYSLPTDPPFNITELPHNVYTIANLGIPSNEHFNRENISTQHQLNQIYTSHTDEFHQPSRIAGQKEILMEHSNPKQYMNNFETTKHSPDGPCSTESITNTTHVSSSREDSGSNSETQHAMQAAIIQPQNVRAPIVFSKMTKLDDLNFQSFMKITLNQNDGRLFLPAVDVQMLVPKESFNDPYPKDVYVNVRTEDDSHPQVKDQQTLLSPVIEIGPEYLRFNKPVLLTFPHCADLTRGHWRIYLFGASLFAQNGTSDYGQTIDYETSVTHLEQLPWKILGTIGEDNWCDGINCYLIGSNAQLLTNVAQFYCLVGETDTMLSRRTGDNRDSVLRMTAGKLLDQNLGAITPATPRKAVKSMILVAFAKPVWSNADFVIRIYVLPAIKHYLNQAVKSERDIGYQMMDIVEYWPFVDNGQGINFQLEVTQTGAGNTLHKERLDIPFHHIWSGSRTSMLHCSFSLQRSSLRDTGSYCFITVRQGDDATTEAILRVTNSNGVKL